MAASEDFTFIDNDGPHNPPQLFPDYKEMVNGKGFDPDVQILTALREKHPELIVTAVPTRNLNLLQFSAAGYAQAELDEDTEPVIRWTGFIGPSHRGGSGQLGDAVFYGKYNYTWNHERFILYTVVIGLLHIQYILKEPQGSETTTSHSSVVDRLLATIGAWLIKEEPAIYVYDGDWMRSTKLWDEVKKAKWEDVILDPKMKKALTEVANKFFDNEDIYREYGVPWKRGLIFHGPVGNGKTISLKALMHTVQERKKPVVTLYVKDAPYPWMLRSVFTLARSMTPCMLVLEDIDTIVTKSTRSYFFNEVDGLENNDGILMIATTNHLDELDPGLSKRPSRFDRKYLFPLPSKSERAQYAQYWRNKLKNKKNIDFPSKLCDAIAGITDDFSFAYLKEAFVATLLELARNRDDGDDDEESSLDNEEDDDDDEDDPLDKYEFWRAFKTQVKILRSEMGAGGDSDGEDPGPGPRPRLPPSIGGLSGLEYEGMTPQLENMRLQDGLQKTALAQSAAGTDVERRFASSARGPIEQFAPLARNKAAGVGVWERGV
ncbi:P-loop containing nucleoside triphosphate hydrolase protein [Bimuria novae-zelandiae CBS 107.79]|uniref:P-loop containing nucleoside triphosphate hydrolase protein n=1 Tax=Bimuria novae-zelandiae CBS 107.79 TaxID=1447943 RepID=A0A6A5VAA8_9PLEO|nr:P-loop containing nucleoside triphosphate hydrolase protein [Bimuria novae-zelandiae CBS 107.79]